MELLRKKRFKTNSGCNIPHKKCIIPVESLTREANLPQVYNSSGIVDKRSKSTCRADMPHLPHISPGWKYQLQLQPLKLYIKVHFPPHIWHFEISNVIRTDQSPFLLGLFPGHHLLAWVVWVKRRTRGWIPADFSHKGSSSAFANFKQINWNPLVEEAATRVARYSLFRHSHLKIWNLGLFWAAKHLSHLLKGEEEVIRNLLVSFHSRFRSIAQVLATSTVPWSNLETLH